MKMKNRVLAVLALALLMINMVPVREAEAAQEVTTKIWGADAKNYTVYDLDEFDWSNWSTFTNYVDYGSADEFVELVCANRPYMVVRHVSKVLYSYYFTQNPVLFSLTNETLNYFYDSVGTVCINVNFETGVPLVSNVIGYPDKTGDSTSYQIMASKNGSYSHCLGSTYDCLSGLSEDDYANYSALVANNNLTYPELPEPEPVTLPVNEPDYTYWLYHKTTSGEYMYWSKDPFDLEVSDGKYILNLSTGDIVYRLHMNPSHTYYRQILSGSMQYVVSPGDIFRSGQELVFDDITIEAWTTGDVTSEEVEKPQYDIPHITKFLSRIRSVRSLQGMPREYAMSIDIALSGDFDEAVTEQKVLIDGNYILPSEEYFRFCDSENIEPSTTHFMKFVKNKQEEYYILVDWSHIESIVNLAGLTSDYGFRLTYSNAIDALIERGEFDELYSQSVQAAYDGDIRKLCCPYRLACTLIGVVDEEYYYGDTFITVLYSELDSNVEDVSGVYSDYVSLDNDQKTDAIESTINDAQDDQLQEYIDKKDAELDALIEEYEMKLAALDTSSSFGGTGDLFTTFSSVANGMAGLSGSFRNLALAVGNVFAFFPEEITGLLFAGIVAMIVIAVYKALRG